MIPENDKKIHAPAGKNAPPGVDFLLMVQVNDLHGFGLVLVQQPQACRVGDRQGEDDSARLGVSPGHDRFHDLILLGTAGHNEDHFLLVDEVHAQETGGTLHAGAFGVDARCRRQLRRHGPRP